jgi:hypothetical protein
MSNLVARPALTNTGALSLEAVKRLAPSVFAKAAHPKMSERYLFVSTYDMLVPMLDQGYIITSATQRSTRSNGRDPNFTRHMLRLRAPNVKPTVGDVVPECVISNAHDGQAKVKVLAGLFRFICSNGLAIAWPGMSVSSTFRHIGEASIVREAIGEAIDVSKKSIKVVSSMTKKKLTHKQQIGFASKAADLVWDEQKFDPALLLEAHRSEDEGDDVWRVYNRIQENLTRGGVRFKAPTSKREFMTRGITHIGRSLELNQGLWTLAEELAA